MSKKQSYALGIDTTGEDIRLALIGNTGVVGTRTARGRQSHSERLFPLLVALLEEAQLRWTDLATIGVGVGPGYFNGIRIGIAAARGLSMALRIPAVGITQFEARSYEVFRPYLVVVPTRGKMVCACRSDQTTPIRCYIDELGEYIDSTMNIAGYRCEDIAAMHGGTAVSQSEPLAVVVARMAIVRSAGNVTPPSPYYLDNPWIGRQARAPKG